MKGDPARYSTPASRHAEAKCRSAASPRAVFHPCGMKRMLILFGHPRYPAFFADAPPTLVTSGCTDRRVFSAAAME